MFGRGRGAFGVVEGKTGYDAQVSDVGELICLFLNWCFCIFRVNLCTRLGKGKINK